MENYIYIQSEKPKTFNCIGLSAMFHALIFVVASFLPAMSFLQQIPLGTTEGTFIEFDAIPQGEQTVETQVAEKISEKPALQKVAAPSAPTPTKSLPQKAVVEKVAEEPVSYPDPVVTSPYEPQSLVADADDSTTELPDVKDSLPTEAPVEKVTQAAPKIVPVDNASEIEKAILEEQQKEQARAIEEKHRREQEALIAKRLADEQRKASMTQARAGMFARPQGGPTTGSVLGNREASEQAARTNVPFGIPGGIRDIADLKQVPGNVPPKYDTDDRFNRREGIVSFVAYVTRGGEVANFKMLKSSGHRTLDLKTLNAVKKWRFYAGQEGWVEIPFRWSLKGDAQEMPNGLRRSLSQR